MEENLLKTCLYDKHVALSALMSPFGGFIMPIQYTSITDEHNAVRQRAGMFDVSHMGEIFVSGPDAEKFVNHIFTNNVTGIPDGKILYGMMLYPSGTVVDDLLVYKEFVRSGNAMRTTTSVSSVRLVVPSGRLMGMDSRVSVK